MGLDTGDGHLQQGHPPCIDGLNRIWMEHVLCFYAPPGYTPVGGLSIPTLAAKRTLAPIIPCLQPRTLTARSSLERRRIVREEVHTGPTLSFCLFPAHRSFIDLVIAPRTTRANPRSTPRRLLVHSHRPRLSSPFYSQPSLSSPLLRVTSRLCNHAAPFPSLRSPSNSVSPTSLSSCMQSFDVFPSSRAVCRDAIECRHFVHSYSFPAHNRRIRINIALSASCAPSFGLSLVGPPVSRVPRCWIGFAVARCRGCESRRVPPPLLFIPSSPPWPVSLSDLHGGHAPPPPPPPPPHLPLACPYSRDAHDPRTRAQDPHTIRHPAPYQQCHLLDP
ncbi:hypothetical protein DFH07DRAFT_1061732, partial [Mycena maculata]